MNAHAVGGAGVVRQQHALVIQRTDCRMAKRPFAEVFPILLEVDILGPLRELRSFVMAIDD